MRSPRSWSRARTSHLLAGTFLSNIGLAVADFAKQKKVFFLAAEPLTDKIVWQQRQPVHLPPAAVDLHADGDAGAATAAKLKKKRWAIVYPNYEYGQSARRAFKELLKKAQPDVEFVAEQARRSARSTPARWCRPLADRSPTRSSTSLFGADLAKFVREGNTRGLFKGREVVSLLTGEPEYLDPLEDEAPNGWIVTGYPWNAINTPEHKKFLDAYQKQAGTTTRGSARSSATRRSSRSRRG